MLRLNTLSYGYRRVKKDYRHLNLLEQPFDRHNLEISAKRRLFYGFDLPRANKPQPNFKNMPYDLDRVERSEVETRILKILYKHELIDMKKFKFTDTFYELKIDSLDRVSILVSIEQEFTTVFTDFVFESVTNLDEIVSILIRDRKII